MSAMRPGGQSDQVAPDSHAGLKPCSCRREITLKHREIAGGIQRRCDPPFSLFGVSLARFLHSQHWQRKIQNPVKPAAAFTAEAAHRPEPPERVSKPQRSFG